MLLLSCEDWIKIIDGSAIIMKDIITVSKGNKIDNKIQKNLTTYLCKEYLKELKKPCSSFIHHLIDVKIDAVSNVDIYNYVNRVLLSINTIPIDYKINLRAQYKKILNIKEGKNKWSKQRCLN